jgi:hypothetical protein
MISFHPEIRISGSFDVIDLKRRSPSGDRMETPGFSHGALARNPFSNRSISSTLTGARLSRAGGFLAINDSRQLCVLIRKGLFRMRTNHNSRSGITKGMELPIMTLTIQISHAQREDGSESILLLKEPL